MNSDTPVGAKKNKRIFLSIIISIVVTALLVFSVIMFQKYSADTAAREYTTAVRTHAESIFSTDSSPKERAELVDKKVAIKNVWLGSQLSDEYKQALELEKRYDSLIDESAYTLKELYTFLDISSDNSDFFQSIGKIALTPAPGFSVTTDNPEDFAASEKFIEVVEKKSKDYAALVDRTYNYTFPSEINDEVKAFAEGLTELSKNEAEKANIQKEYNERIKTDGFKEDDGEATLAEMNRVIAEGLSAYDGVREDVKVLIKAYVDGGVAERLVKNSDKVNNDFEAFIKSLN